MVLTPTISQVLEAVIAGKPKMCVRTRLECKVINDLSQLESTHMVLNEVKISSIECIARDVFTHSPGTCRLACGYAHTHTQVELGDYALPHVNGCDHRLAHSVNRRSRWTAGSRPSSPISRACATISLSPQPRYWMLILPSHPSSSSSRSESHMLYSRFKKWTKGHDHSNLPAWKPAPSDALKSISR
jgi:hypothetical protein